MSPPPYAPDWQYEWDVRDHLGNLRLVYNDLNGDDDITSDEIVQVANYYPYGLRYANTEKSALKNQYLYNGIDYVGDFGLELSMATFRNLQSDRATWLSVDPKAEAVPSLSIYQHANNNPISYADPEGDFPWLAIGIASALQGIGGGINSANNGGSFFGGFAKGALIGGATSAATAGIGGLFGHGVGSFGTELARAGAHGVVGGLSSVANGGSFGSGFLGSAVSSGFASGLSGTTGLSQYVGGALAGGFSNLAGGGNFFIGAGQGLAITALNHNGGGCPPSECPNLNDLDITITANRTNIVGSAAIAASALGNVSTHIGHSLLRNGQFRGSSGNFYDIRTSGFNQYTGTKAQMSTVLRNARIASRFNIGFGSIGAASNIHQLGTGRINGGQFSIEMASTGISTFAPANIAIPWTIGYEGLGRNIIGRTGWYRNRVRPWIRRNIWRIKD